MLPIPIESFMIETNKQKKEETELNTTQSMIEEQNQSLTMCPAQLRLT